MRISFRCFFPNGHFNQHYQEINIRDIHLWALAYKFTHPDCKSMTIQLKWEEGNNVSGHGAEQSDRPTKDDVQL